MVNIAPVQFLDKLWKNPRQDPNLSNIIGAQLGYIPNEALNLLNTITVSSATGSVSDNTSFLRTDFDTFMVTWEALINNTNNRQPLFSVNVGGVQTTGYIGCLTTNTGGTLAGSAVTGSVPIGPFGANAAPGAAGMLFIFNPAGTANKKMMVMQGGGATTTPAAVNSTYVGYFNTNANAVTGFQIAMSGGNIASGIVRTYGIRTS